jgi:heat shock protein HtpX
MFPTVYFGQPPALAQGRVFEGGASHGRRSQTETPLEIYADGEFVCETPAEISVAAGALLAQKIGLPMPRIYVIPTDSPNAFATGRNPNHASVAVTQGILGLLTDDELEGVLAHELGHVRNRDILISSIAATLAGAITYLASIAKWGMIFGGMRGDREERGGGGIAAIAMIFLAPFAAMLIQLAVSRSREYGADDTGAHWTGNPYALASALAKIDAYSKQRPLIASPSTAHLFIIQPFLGGLSFANLFSTHPPTAKRIERLTGRPADFGQ